ncbi:MAG: S8 family serine peptidase [Gemmatimonadales bacterium]
MAIRRSLRRLAGGALILSAAAACSDQALAPKPRDVPQPAYAPLSRLRTPSSRYLVSFRSAEPGTFATRIRGFGGRVERRFGDMNLAVVKDIGAIGAAALAADPAVEAVVPDLRLQFIPRPNGGNHPLGVATSRTPGTDQSGTFFFPIQYNIRQVRADQAWSRSTGGRNALVCILDTGIDPDHAEFQGKLEPGMVTSFISEPLIPGDLDSLDYNFHGTATAGFVSTNGFAMASVAPDARLCSAKVLDYQGVGSFADIIAGITWAADHRADVINLSLGGTVDLGDPDARQIVRLMERAILRANLKGSVVIASAGNDTLDLDHDPRNLLVVPAQLAGVISVGAVAPVNLMNFDGLASYSNFGGRTGVDLMAPGGDLAEGGAFADLLVAPCSEYALPEVLGFACGATSYLGIAGTSESAPHVSGAAAVLKAKFGRLAVPLLVQGCLERSADAIGPRAIFGSGRLDVLGAVGCRP